MATAALVGGAAILATGAVLATSEGWRDDFDLEPDAVLFFRSTATDDLVFGMDAAFAAADLLPVA